MSVKRLYGALGKDAPWFLSVFIIGMVIGVVSDQIFFPRELGEHEELVEVRAEGYRYTRPLMECEIHDPKGRNRELTSFRAEIKKKVEELQSKGKANLISVYFRDLNNGPAFSINPQEDFVPASLLKVPTMISALKVAEANPGFLSTPITLPRDFPIDRGQTFVQGDFMSPGGTYTIEDLVYRMIVHSDNSATLALNMILPKDSDKKVFGDLGVGLHEHQGRTDWLPVGSYASFFRILFNSSYLNREMSEKALSVLAQTQLPPGLAPLAPEGVEVAQKFGHFRLPGDGGTEQLHLCGIVYFPDHPYLVCAMTRGNNLVEQSEAISEIGKAIYGEVGRRVAPSGEYSVN